MNSVIVRLARPRPHHASKLERDGRPRGQDAAVRKAPGSIVLAAGRERARGRGVNWTGSSTQLRCATVRFGSRQTVHLLVEKLGETGWDWHVWVQAGWTWARYGLAGTAEHAREQAERALVGLMRSDTDGNVPLGLNCQFVLFPQRGA